MLERQARRAELATLLAEDIDDIDSDEPDVEGAAEGALGKESSDKLKAAMNRIGADMRTEGGYRFFLHNATEREFDAGWIRNVGWMSGFEGTSMIDFPNDS
jgi:hypothetical protein